jgi:hypothetical protein
MKFSFNLFIFLTFFVATACKKNEVHNEVTTIEVNDLAEEQRIPKVLLQAVDEQFKEQFRSSPPIYSFIPLTVAFQSDQNNVLSLNKYIYKFPKGGGKIDLRDILKGEGSFYLYFPEEQFNKENELVALYFVSRSPQVEIDGEKFGLGCGKWTDLKNSFSKLQKQDYLKLNTNSLRYLRVAGGTFVFIFKNGRNIQLAQFTVADSRHINEMCMEATDYESK